MNCKDDQLHPDFAPLADWLLGPIRLALMDAAMELELPDLLAKTGDPDKLASRLKVHRQNLCLFLDALTGLGLAEKKDGFYYNTPLADRYLRRDRETWLGEMLHNLRNIQHRNLDNLVELIRSGPSELKGEKRLDSEEQWKNFASHLINYQKADLAHLAADIAESLPEFPHAKKMLDLGGGPGLAGMAILQRHPRLEGVLCDMPSMIHVAREQAQAKGLQGRMTYISGDYNQVDLGESYDLIWTSHALYYVQNFSHFFSRIYNSLNPGGVFLSLHEGLSNERTFPPYHVLARISLALEGQDVSFSQGFISEKMRESGFAKIDSQSLELSMGPVWLDIARKSETTFSAPNPG